MSRRLLRILVVLIAMAALGARRAEAEVKLVRPDPDKTYRLAIVSDGPKPSDRWMLRYYSYLPSSGKPWVESRFVPAGADRMLFIHGSVLHLIDTREGVVLNRWLFPDPIVDVQVEGDRFHVRTEYPDDKSIQETQTLKADSPSPPHWLGSAFLSYRAAIFEATWFDKAVGLEQEYDSKTKRILPRRPLAGSEALELLAELEDAVRRNPFSPQLGVCLALVLRDLGRGDSETVFRRAIERPTNRYGELYLTANLLENIGAAEWSTLAFEQAYARQWEQGADPRMFYGFFPRLMTLYLPYDLRNPMPKDRRFTLIERIYRIAPYVESAPVAWGHLSRYLSERDDSQGAAVWRERAIEAEAKTGYAWELAFYLERMSRVVVALLLTLFVYYVALQLRYAPQRRLLRAGKSGWRGLVRLSPFSLACWDRQDRQILFSLLALFWLAPGIWGVFAEGAMRSMESPLVGASGTFRSPLTQKHLQQLPASPDRDLLLAISLQQAEKYDQAEGLYRALPDSATRWNNLGVLQAKQGRAKEAEESFEEALRIDPQSAEAAFNVGRPVSDPWVEMHSKYLPGQKILDLPSHDVFYRVNRGPWSGFVQSLGGPFLGVPIQRKAIQWFSENRGMPLDAPQSETAPRTFFFTVLLLPFALGVIAFFTPYREVTQPPGKAHWVLALLLPGSAREWGRAGGIVLATAIWGLLELISAKGQGWTPLDARVQSLRAFGADVETITPQWPGDPGWFWDEGIVVLTILLFVFNAILVLRSRYRAASRTAG